MMAWLRHNLVVAALAALAVVLVVVITLESRFGANVASATRPGAARRAAPAEAKLLPPLAVAAAEQAYPETAARPLFTPTRRPAPEVAATPQSTFQKGQFVLQGVIAVGDNRVAMLREKSTGRIHRVERGREVNGIKVIAIEPEAVTLGQGGEEEKLGLTVQKAPAGAATGVSQGPFAISPPSAPVGGANAPGSLLGQPTPSPFPRPAPAPGVPPQNISQSGAAPTANPAARAAPEAASPLTPEELLARRRARRTQQTQ
jgi:hypothetical protein